MKYRTFTILMLLALLLVSVVPITAQEETLEPWQLTSGSFVTASDVTAHNQLAQDRADIVELAATGAWSEALAIYAFGKNFPWKGQTHSYGRFADNYNGVMPDVLPDSVALFESATFMDDAISSALRGTGAFASASPEARVAFVDAALLAATLNWTRFELAMAEKKAKAQEPNWSLENGSPKNWNEIFAFYYGPEGQHSLYQALAQLAEGEALNQRLFEVLARGQETLLKEQWDELAATEVAALLDQAALLLFTSTLEQAEQAQSEAYLKGYWLAAAESFSKIDSSQAEVIHEQLLADIDLNLLRQNVSLVAQEATECEDGFRLIVHAMGETCVTEAPQRVVVLDTGETDNALALGASVVGAPVSDVNQYQAYLTPQLDGITDTGTISEPNLEVILSLNPDLILGSSQRYEAIYEELSLIAPTVFTESLRVPWQDNFTLHAAALDREAEAEELLAGYDAHIAEVQAVLGDNLDNTTISIIRFRPGQVRLYLKSSYIGYILQDIGLPRPASQDEDVFSAEISLEEVQAVDADYIFITGYAQDDSDQDTFLNSPLWQTLEAVQNGRAIDVNDDTWIAGLGVQAANLVLDDLETILVDAAE